MVRIGSRFPAPRTKPCNDSEAGLHLRLTDFVSLKSRLERPSGPCFCAATSSRPAACAFMVYGLWFMVYGLWFMVYGLWFMVYGLWRTACGLWFMVCGLWFMVYGSRLMVYGLCFMVDGL